MPLRSVLLTHLWGRSIVAHTYRDIHSFLPLTMPKGLHWCISLLCQLTGVARMQCLSALRSPILFYKSTMFSHISCLFILIPPTYNNLAFPYELCIHHVARVVLLSSRCPNSCHSGKVSSRLNLPRPPLSFQ